MTEVQANPEGTFNHEEQSASRRPVLPAVQLFGSPGCGKTALIDATVRSIWTQARVGVIVAHLAAQRDASMLRAAGAVAMPLETATADYAEIESAIREMNRTDPALNLLLIESPGLLINARIPAVGHAARVAVFSITGGDDKAAEYPDRVRDADLVVLTKLDLLSKVHFDLGVFRADVGRLNSKAPIIELSALTGAGMDSWNDWLLSYSIRARTERTDASTPESSEWWFG